MCSSGPSSSDVRGKQLSYVTIGSISHVLFIVKFFLKIVVNFDLRIWLISYSLPEFLYVLLSTLQRRKSLAIWEGNSVSSLVLSCWFLPCVFFPVIENVVTKVAVDALLCRCLCACACAPFLPKTDSVHWCLCSKGNWGDVAELCRKSSALRIGPRERNLIMKDVILSANESKLRLATNIFTY